MPLRSRCRLVAALLLAAALPACGSAGGVPAPDAAVDAYARALAAGDADALYAMMSEKSRQAVSRAELGRVVGEQRAELEEHARNVTRDDREIRARAELRFPDGEAASLELVDGQFLVTSSDALPAAARTPAQALDELRRVLARRSYAGLLRVLSPRTRAAIESDLRSLVEGLERPDALPIDRVGDRATVEVPGGHRVLLKREDGVWHVDDFE